MIDMATDACLSLVPLDNSLPVVELLCIRLASAAVGAFQIFYPPSFPQQAQARARYHRVDLNQ